MGSTQCQHCEDNKNQIQLQYNLQGTFTTLEEIQDKFKIYALNNMLSLHPPRCQRAIQQLYILGQFHICDLIIQLGCKKKKEQLDRLLDEIQAIDLQTLDHLTLIKNSQSVQFAKSIRNANSIFQVEDIRTSMTNQQLKLTARQTSTFKIVSKNWLRVHNINQQDGINILKSSQLVLMATVQCFDGIGVLKKLKCPTKKTALRLFLQKVETVNSLYYSRLIVIFIVNPQFEKKFDRQISKYHQDCAQQLGEDSTLISPQISFIKILYQPCFPSVNLKRKIQILNGSKLKFNYLKGDLIGFVLKNKQIQAVLQKFEFIQISNISNILQVIAERSILTYLVNHKEIQIVALTTSDEKSNIKNENLRLNQGFIQKFTQSISTLNMNHKKCYQLTKSFYLRTSLLTNKGKSFQALISSKIQSQAIDAFTFHFVRSFENILYAPLTSLVIVQKYEYASSKMPEIELSNYCKQVLGIKDTSNEQMVEICPQVLYGDKNQLKDIFQQLQELSVGFPLIINKQKIDPMISEAPSQNMITPRSVHQS